MQDELLQKLGANTLHGKEQISLEACEGYVDAISEMFPFLGSKIKWSEVPGHFHQRNDRQRLNESAQGFLNQLVVTLHLADDELIIVIGDSVMDIAVKLPLFILRKHLNDFIELPQHTYIVSESVQWCACFTMEGDMDFGVSPKSMRGG